jgi:hypothetical protein
MGFQSARVTGAEVHDEIEMAPGRTLTGNVRRRTNRAGGLEGGMTTGEPLVVRVAMKPISTLMRPLGTIDIATREAAAAVAERSDVTAVPAMGVIAEAMLAIVLADAFLEKFAGDSLDETRRNYDAYLSHIAARSAADPRSRTSILVGLPGAGKSTVGRAVAERLARAFLDLDKEIERRELQSITEIFAMKGEPYFRESERNLTQEIRESGNMILSPGGGWVANPEVVRLLRPPGQLIYLKVRPETALKRLGSRV